MHHALRVGIQPGLELGSLLQGVGDIQPVAHQQRHEFFQILFAAEGLFVIKGLAQNQGQAFGGLDGFRAAQQGGEEAIQFFQVHALQALEALQGSGQALVIVIRQRCVFHRRHLSVAMAHYRR